MDTFPKSPAPSPARSRQVTGCLWFLCLGVLLLQSDILAQVRSGASFLRLMPGARQQGIAGNGAAVLDDPHAVYANPGAAGFLREWQWSATYTRWIAEVYSASLLYGWRMRMPWSPSTRFALQLAYQGLPEFDSSRGAAAAASANDLLVAASIGQPFSLLGRNLAVGASLKYLESELAQYRADTWIADLGLLYRSERFRLRRSGGGALAYGIVSGGVAITQLGGDLTFIATGTPLPRTLRAGLAFNAGSHHGLQVQLATEYRKVRAEQGAFSLGTEISWDQIVGLRSGYDFEDNLISHFVFGLTLRLDDRQAFSSIIPGRNNALRLDLASSEEQSLFGRPYRGSVTHQPLRPEGFRLLTPPRGATVESDSVLLSWEASRDPDLYDDLDYWLLVDRDSLKLAGTLAAGDRSAVEFISSLATTDFAVQQRTRTTRHAMAGLTGGDYYWTVVAHDQDQHLRYAGKSGERIWHFRVTQPDLQIIALTFTPDAWITTDDLQGTLTVTVSNTGRRTATGLLLAVRDTLATAGARSSIVVAQSLPESTIAEVRPGESQSVSLEWRTATPGWHDIIAEVSGRQHLGESDTGNNRYRATFATIPKGSFGVPDTVTVVRLSRQRFEVPLVPVVCFARGSAAVPSEYLRQWVFEPPLVTLAQRLSNNRQLRVKLQGFIDANSGESDLALAEARAAAVRDSLFNLGVAPNQLGILPGAMVPRRRVPADSTDARWLFHENRRVEMVAEPEGEAVLFELVGFDDVEPLAVSVGFQSDIAGVVPFNDGRVELAAGELAGQLDLKPVLFDATLRQTVLWDEALPGAPDRARWTDRLTDYTLMLTDSLGRTFRTRPRAVYLAAESILRAQHVAFPIRFQTTDPLYEFYWNDILTQVGFMLNHTDMRVRFTGHACAIGPEAVNQRLSQKRAEAFRDGFLRVIREHRPEAYDLLLQRLDPARGAGESEPMKIERLSGSHILIGNNESPLGRKLNRRLEMEFYRRSNLLSGK